MSKTFERQATGLVREVSAFRAFVLNLMFTSPAFMLIFLVLGQGLFPGAYLPISSLLALIPALIVAFVYAQLSVAYPRSGGDYVFIGRILHPSVGFMVNFVFTLINISVIGTEAVWITSMALGPMFNALAAISNNPGLAGLASTLTVPVNEFIVGALIAIVLPFVMYFGASVSFKLKTFFFVVSAFSILTFLVAMAVTSNANFVSNFDSLSTTSYSQTIAAAQNAGVRFSYNFGDTLLGVVYTILAVYGFTASTYIGGEVKNPQRSQTIGMVVAPVVYIVLMTLVAFVTYSSMGHDFLASISYLALNGNAAFKLPVSLPILQFLGGYGTRNSVVEVILGLGLLTTLFGYMLSASYTSVRVLFAWSFDSVIPRKFAEVSEKYHVPYVSLIAIIIVNIVFVYLTVYSTISAFFTYVVTGSFIGLVFVGIAALVFPMRRKEVFASSPSITSRRVAGIPVVSLLGAASIILGIMIAYASLLPALVGPLNPTYISVVPLLFIVGFVFYWVSYAIQKSRGIPVEKLHTEIPPE
jgi:APA family basic amino acid/polyamine antiporter